MDVMALKKKKKKRRGEEGQESFCHLRPPLPPPQDVPVQTRPDMGLSLVPDTPGARSKFDAHGTPRNKSRT